MVIGRSNSTQVSRSALKVKTSIDIQKTERNELSRVRDGVDRRGAPAKPLILARAR
jgi:hypothetical protein